METQTIVLLIILWLLCGLLSYGWVLASYLVYMKIHGFPDEYIKSGDRLYGIVVIMFGIASLLSAVYLNYHKYGWRL